MNSKQIARKRRGLKTKAICRKSGRARLVVYRSASHIYAQIVNESEKGSIVLVAASTIDKEFKNMKLQGTKVEKAQQVGKLLAERAKSKKIKEISFDRGGYKYHGRLKALADGAREAGLEF